MDIKAYKDISSSTIPVAMIANAIPPTEKLSKILNAAKTTAEASSS